MSILSKRATIYLDPSLHHLLKLKAVETSRSISDLIDDAIRNELLEDEGDLRSFEARAKEPTISFEKMLREFKANGTL